jgi:hypothetical protein
MERCHPAVCASAASAPYHIAASAMTPPTGHSSAPKMKAAAISGPNPPANPSSG